MICTTVVEEEKMPISIDDVAYVPKLTANILLVSCIQQKGLEVNLKTGDDGTKMVVIDQKDTGTVVMMVIDVRLGLNE